MPGRVPAEKCTAQATSHFPPNSSNSVGVDRFVIASPTSFSASSCDGAGGISAKTRPLGSSFTLFPVLTKGVDDGKFSSSSSADEHPLTVMSNLPNGVGRPTKKAIKRAGTRTKNQRHISKDEFFSTHWKFILLLAMLAVISGISTFLMISSRHTAEHFQTPEKVNHALVPKGKASGSRVGDRTAEHLETKITGDATSLPKKRPVRFPLGSEPQDVQIQSHLRHRTWQHLRHDKEIVEGIPVAIGPHQKAKQIEQQESVLQAVNFLENPQEEQASKRHLALFEARRLHRQRDPEMHFVVGGENK